MKDAEGETIETAAWFFLPEGGDDDPKLIAAALVAELPEFMHLRIGEPVIMFVMRGATKIKAGRTILGEMALPHFMGALGAFGTWLLAKACGGELPDFIMFLDAFWWTEADANGRRALVHHELKHADHARDREGEPKFDDDGRPIWALAPHDLEEFQDTVRRHGAWSPDIPPFVDALREGGAIP